MAGCPVCHGEGPGDPSVGIMEDDGLCPRCEEEGWEQAPCGCLSGPMGEHTECKNHEGNAAEAAHELMVENYYGASSPQTEQERYDAAVEQKRTLR